MKKSILVIFFLSAWASAQDQRPPRKYYLEVNRALENSTLWPTGEIKNRMISRHKTPAEWFTEKRSDADYILRISDVDGNCRWTLLWNDRTKNEEIVVGSKEVFSCGKADGDVLDAADKDFLERRMKK